MVGDVDCSDIMAIKDTTDWSDTCDVAISWDSWGESCENLWWNGLLEEDDYEGSECQQVDKGFEAIDSDEASNGNFVLHAPENVSEGCQDLDSFDLSYACFKEWEKLELQC